MLKPFESFQNSAEGGAVRVNRSALKTFVCSFLSGCHLGFGSYLAQSIGNQCPGILATNPGLKQLIYGSIGFPFVVLMTVISGGDIFTGDIFTAGCSRMEGKITTLELIRFLTLVYLGNFFGALFMVGIVASAGTLGPAEPIKAALAKTVNLSFKGAFARGLLCSWLIGMAVFNACSGVSLTDKAIAIFSPIMAFNALALENAPSNMFTIPLGIYLGAKVSFKTYLLRNLLPVTLGNLVGGFVFVVFPYAFLTSDARKKAA